MPSKRIVAFPNYITGPAAARPSAEGLPNNVIYASDEGVLSRTFEGVWVSLADPAGSAASFRIHGWHDPIRRSSWADNFVAGSGGRYNLSPTGATTPCWLEWDLWLGAGTYRCLVQALRATTIGVSEVLVDGLTFGTWDGYAAGTTYVDYRLGTTRTLAEGLHTIRLAKTGTKNASATEYYVAMSELTLVKT